MCGTVRVGDLNAAILRSARVGCVICNRLGLAKAFGCKPVAGDSMLCEPGDDRLGARFRERLIVGIAANIVCVSLDLDLLRGTLLQQIQNLLQHRITGGLKRGLVEVGGLPSLLRKLSSAGIGCSCAMSGRVMKASIAAMTAKRKQDTAAPKSESAKWRMYTSECLKSKTRSRRFVSRSCAQFDLYRQVGLWEIGRAH